MSTGKQFTKAEIKEKFLESFEVEGLNSSEKRVFQLLGKTIWIFILEHFNFKN